VRQVDSQPVPPLAGKGLPKRQRVPNLCRLTQCLGQLPGVPRFGTLSVARAGDETDPVKDRRDPVRRLNFPGRFRFKKKRVALKSLPLPLS
jgi:hypothetical protein